MNAFISVAQESRWRFDPSVLISAMKQRWPDTRFRPKTQTAALRWSIPLPADQGITLDGFLNSLGDVVGFEGWEQSCLAFALWLQQIVPPEVPLVLGDDQHGDVIKMTANVTEQEVLMFWHSQ